MRYNRSKHLVIEKNIAINKKIKYRFYINIGMKSDLSYFSFSLFSVLNLIPLSTLGSPIVI